MSMARVVGCTVTRGCFVSIDGDDELALCICSKVPLSIEKHIIRKVDFIVYSYMLCITGLLAT